MADQSRSPVLDRREGGKGGYLGHKGALRRQACQEGLEHLVTGVLDADDHNLTSHDLHLGRV